MSQEMSKEKVAILYRQAELLAHSRKVPGLEYEDLVQELVSGGFKQYAKRFDESNVTYGDVNTVFAAFVRNAMLLKLRALYKDQNQLNRKTGWFATSIRDIASKIDSKVCYRHQGERRPEDEPVQSPPTLPEALVYTTRTPLEERVLRVVKSVGEYPSISNIEEFGLTPEEFSQGLRTLRDKAGWREDTNSPVWNFVASPEEELSYRLIHLNLNREEAMVASWIATHGIGGRVNSKAVAARELGIPRTRFDKAFKSLTKNEKLREALKAA